MGNLGPQGQVVDLLYVRAQKARAEAAERRAKELEIQLAAQRMMLAERDRVLSDLRHELIKQRAVR